MAPASRPRVLIAGGGVAALEAALTLHDVAGDALDITLAAPAEVFRFHPLATADAFALGHVGRLSLASFARDVSARHEPVSVHRVDPAGRQVRFSTGEERRYDQLLLAVGARPVPAVAGATTWWDETDPQVLADLVGRLQDGRAHRVVFVVTPGCGWPLPLYELALMTAHALPDAAREQAELTIVTHEAAPLSLFGPRASAAVSAELESVGIELRTASYVDGDRSTERELVLLPGRESLAADDLVALPRLEGPRLSGVPANRLGFLPVDPFGRVVGVDDIWAAGDATAFPVKQGGLAGQQAEAAALSLAAAAGAEVEPVPFEPVLRGTLLTGEEGLRARRPLWWPPAKVAGRRLSPYLAQRPDGPAGLDVEVAIGAPATAPPLAAPLLFGRRSRAAPSPR